MNDKSKPTRILQTDLDPDGVRIVVDWDKFRIDSSVFIPCLNTKEAIRQFRERGKFQASELHEQVLIENGYYGVRIWRIK